MGLPIKKKTKNIDKKIDKALEMAGANENQTPTQTTKQSRGGESKKKPGKPPLAGERNARLACYLTDETASRFDLAYLSERLKRAKKQEKIDKSLLVEIVLKEWLDKNKY